MRGYGISCDHCSYEGELVMEDVPEVCPKCGVKHSLTIRPVPIQQSECCGVTIVDGIEADSGIIKGDAWCPKCGKWFSPAK